MAARTHLLVIDRFPVALQTQLQALDGFTLHHHPDCTAEEAAALLPQAEVLLLRSKLRLTAEQIANANQLKAVIRAGAGLDEIDSEALEARGIQLLHCAGANARAVGEQALGMLISLMAHTHRANREVRQGIWERNRNRGEELSGRTVGIIGFGHTGRAFAKKLAGFDCNLMAYDPYAPPQMGDAARAATLGEIQQQAEVLSFHVPLTTETQYYYDADFSRAMQHPHWLINCARGAVLHLDAVIDGLSTGHIRGAGIDVLPDEHIAQLSGHAKAQFDALAHHPDVILTPHIAGRTHQSEAAIAARVVAHLRALS